MRFKLPHYLEHGHTEFHYENENGEKVGCNAKELDIFAPALKAKFPEINHIHATCDDDVEIHAVVTRDKPHLCGGSVKSGADEEFIEFKYDNNTGMFDTDTPDIIVDDFEPTRRSLKGEYDPNVEDLLFQFDEIPGKNFSGAPGQMKGEIYVSRALFLYVYVDRIVCDRYSSNSEVMSALSIMIGKLNGIYNRELGLFFKFPTNQDKFLCSAENNCNDTPYSNKLDFLRSLHGLFPQAHIVDNVDVMHGISGNIVGGVAYIPSFCVQTYGGVSGAKGIDITSDLFVIDLMAHEVGHQFGMGHSFRDCYGNSGKILTIEDAIEPGSGVSVMSYAGYCESGKNIESRAQPYFTAVGLHKARNFLQSLYKGTCGNATIITKDMTTNIPTMIDMADVCDVPLKGRFALSADVENAKYFTWESNTTGYVPFGDNSADQFILRSYYPTGSVTRWIPNFFNVAYNPDGYKKFEHVPETTEQSSFMLLMSRTTFSLTNTPVYDYDPLKSGLIIENSTSINFVNKGHLKLETITPSSGNTYVSASDEVVVKWDPGDDLGSNVELLYGVLPSTWDLRKAHLLMPDFVSLLNTSNSGTATITFPQASTVTKSLWMVRTTDSPYCFHWDSKVVDLNGNAPPISFSGGDSGDSSSTLDPAVIGGAAGGGVVFLFIFYYWFCRTSKSTASAKYAQANVEEF